MKRTFNTAGTRDFEKDALKVWQHSQCNQRGLRIGSTPGAVEKPHKALEIAGTMFAHYQIDLQDSLLVHAASAHAITLIELFTYYYDIFILPLLTYSMCS